MGNTKNYVIEYGSKLFEDRPFSLADAILFCEVTYMPLEKAISPSFDVEPVEFSAGCRALFDVMANPREKLGLGITQNVNTNLIRMATLPRFCQMKIQACRAKYSPKPALQYGACTFILPDGTNVVMFRGTDDTIAGWREDADIFLRKGMASYPLALDYIKELAEKRDGDIIICGHSKGGNVAVYTAVNSDESIRNRIKGVYNLDGPGFHDYSIYQTDAYKALLPNYHHVVPTASFVGMLLFHDYDYSVAKSTRHIGFTQHDIGSWIIENGELQTAADTNNQAKIVDDYSVGLLSNVDEAESHAIELVLDAVLFGIGHKTLTDMMKHVVSSAAGAIKEVKALEPETRTLCKQAFSGSIDIIKASINKIRDKTVDKVVHNL